MAKDEEAPPPNAGGELSKKMVIIIVIVSFIAVGAGIGVTWYLLSGSDSSSEFADESTDTKPDKAEALYVELKPAMIVTYDVEGRQRYMQASLSLMTRNQDVMAAVELHMPVIRNKLLNVFGSWNFEDLQTNEGRLAMQQEALAVINDVIKLKGVEGEVERILYTNLVLK